MTNNKGIVRKEILVLVPLVLLIFVIGCERETGGTFIAF